ncbi:MAG TPA: hypothetical protein VLD62_11625 [Acidimicrobiia bacterium]|nr:hypothetical protein [Acidimicrobiia bacterium]
MSGEHPTIGPVLEPLSERFPGYLAAFGVGGVAAIVVGLIVTAASSVSLVNGVGYALVGLGTLLLLVGGARGGGYANLGIGAVDALVGGRNRTDEDFSDSDVRRGRVTKRRDPMERLRRGLRPPPNPTAFWQTIAGFAYIAAGAALVLNWG